MGILTTMKRPVIYVESGVARCEALDAVVRQLE